MITVIGGSGFIGTNLCRILETEGTPFEIIDLKESPCFPEKTTIADIRDYEVIKAAISGDTIINLAAVHRDDVRDRSFYYSTNVDGNRNICRVADERNIRKIVFTSTVAVYGFAEPDTAEDGTINPFNDYGKSKFEGENVLRDWYASDKDNISLSIIRPTVVFGEGNRGNVYNLFSQIQSGKFLMVGEGLNRKSMAYVGNVAAFLRHMADQGPGYHLYNYVDKPDYNMNELVSLVRRRVAGKEGVGPRIPLPVGLVIGLLADVATSVLKIPLPISYIRVRKFTATTAFSSAAHQLEGFVAPYTIEEGIERTLISDFINPDETAPVFFTE